MEKLGWQVCCGVAEVVRRVNMVVLLECLEVPFLEDGWKWIDPEDRW